MKKNVILGIAAATLSIAGIATIGTNLVGSAKSSIETKAAQPEGKANICLYYSDNGWAWPGNDFYFTWTHGENGWNYYRLTVDLTKDSQFLIKDWEHGDEGMKSYDGTTCLQGLINLDNGDKNLRCLLTGNYTITYAYKDGSNRCITGFELNNATEMYYVRNSNVWSNSTLFSYT